MSQLPISIPMFHKNDELEDKFDNKESYNVSLDIEFLGLPKECMNAPVIIETDVLNREGVIYIIITKSAQRLVHDRKYCEVSAIDSG